MKIQNQQYDSIFDNTLSLKESALHLKDKNCGHAISLLVLSMDELIKYILEMLHPTGQMILTEGMRKKLYSHHTTKHNLIEEFFNSISDECADEYFTSYISSGCNFKDALNITSNRFPSWGFVFRISKNEWRLSLQEKDAFDLWKENANKLKQLGFYATLENKKIITPADLSNAQFVLFKQTEFMKSVDLTNEEIKEWQKANSD